MTNSENLQRESEVVLSDVAKLRQELVDFSESMSIKTALRSLQPPLSKGLHDYQEEVGNLLDKIYQLLGKIKSLELNKSTEKPDFCLSIIPNELEAQHEWLTDIIEHIKNMIEDGANYIPEWFVNQVTSPVRAASNRKNKPKILSKKQALELVKDKGDKYKCSDFDEVDQTDVHFIKNPAYVVKEITKSSESEGGCIVEWNEAFEKLTNFTPSDIDDSHCNELMQGIQELYTIEGQVYLYNKRRIAARICQISCPFRTYSDRHSPKAQVIRNVWIYSKDQQNGPIRRQVDIYVFPYKEENNKYALHILFDRKRARGIKHFGDTFWIKNPKGDDFIPAPTEIPQKQDTSA